MTYYLIPTFCWESVVTGLTKTFCGLYFTVNFSQLPTVLPIHFYCTTKCYGLHRYELHLPLEIALKWASLFEACSYYSLITKSTDYIFIPSLPRWEYGILWRVIFFSLRHLGLRPQSIRGSSPILYRMLLMTYGAMI